MRLFIAAEVPDKMRDALTETSALLRENVRGRFVSYDSLHVTLAFLGDVEDCRVNDVCTALERACSAALRFDATLGDLGCFGKRKKATLWQGFHDAGALPDLAKSVRDKLSANGFTFDDKAYLAHVTLMRAVDLTTGLLPSPLRVTDRFESVSLFRSDLSGERPVYEPLHSVFLT